MIIKLVISIVLGYIIGSVLGIILYCMETGKEIKDIKIK